MMTINRWFYFYLFFLCLGGILFSYADRNDKGNSAHYLFAYLKKNDHLPSTLFYIPPGEALIFLRADANDGFEHTVLPTDTFTIPENGAYLISFGASIETPGTGLELQINGSAIPGSYLSLQSQADYTELSIILRLNRGDRLIVRNPAGSPPLKLVNPNFFPLTDKDRVAPTPNYCATLMIALIGP